jgi:hypothetical protein
LEKAKEAQARLDAAERNAKAALDRVKDYSAAATSQPDADAPGAPADEKRGAASAGPGVAKKTATKKGVAPRTVSKKRPVSGG